MITAHVHFLCISSTYSLNYESFSVLVDQCTEGKPVVCPTTFLPHNFFWVTTFLACSDQVSIFSGVACGLQTVCSTRGDVVRVAEGRKLTRGDLV